MTLEAKLADRWLRDPVLFVRENFRVEPDDWQVKVLRAFPKFQRLAMKAAKGCGKTTVLAWLILNFLTTRPNSNIAATSISGDNLRDGLWKEIAKWLQRSEFLQTMFEVQKQRIVSKQTPLTWWCSARQWSRSADEQHAGREASATAHGDGRHEQTGGKERGARWCVRRGRA